MNPSTGTPPPRSTLVVLIALGMSLLGTAVAKPFWMPGASAQDGFLAPDAAFRPSAHVDGKRLHVRWVIADGYYLYRSRIEVRAESPDLVVESPVLPPGGKITDAYFGTQEVYRQVVDVTAAYHQLDYGAHPIQIRLSYQGCAEAGLCYPLLTKVIFPDAVAASIETPAAVIDTAPATAKVRPYTPGPSGREPGTRLPVIRTGGGSSAWEPVAISGGVLAFLLAGLRLRSRRGADTRAGTSG